jgi:hypothetical protein
VVGVPLSHGTHVAPGTPIVFGTNPPATGTHYESWAAWNRTYDDPPLDRGYYVHNAEHGGVVYLYNCPAGCHEVVAGLEALVASLPDDPHCEAPLRTRTLISADPLLPERVTVAAVTWGFIYTASCFDAASLRTFYDERHGRSYENTCADGLVP